MMSFVRGAMAALYVAMCILYVQHSGASPQANA
jgi:hypothetical protein